MKIEWVPTYVYEQLSNYIEKNSHKEKLVAFIDTKESKAIRTRTQEKSYYRLFNWIAQHLWNNIQEVKIYFLIGCFWSKKIQLSKNYIEIPIISQTRDLTKEQAIFLIDTLIAFTKLKNIPCEITSRELESLYNSYN